jgi:C1A family cysteine protease
MKAVLFLAILATTVLAAPRYEDEFLSFVETYNKKYDATEIFHRFSIFKAKVDEVAAWNAGNHTWRMGINEFSDLTWEEFSTSLLGFVDDGSDSSPEYVAPWSNRVPNDVDWRQKGGVTPVKNQGQCGSCWDFAGTGTIETFNFVKTGQLINLSEQQVLDCSKGGSCGGGMPEQAMDWGCRQGLCLTSEYPYTARQGTCKQCAAKSAKCGGSKKLASEAAQAQALEANTVSIGVYIGANFQSYKSGIFNGPCGSGGHAMVLVGFTSDAWIVKNSWGASWGAQGYSNWARGKNLCQFSGHSHVPQ